MAGHNRNGGFAKPKDAKKTVKRLLGYLSQSKLPLAGVFLCLILSVCSNVGGSYYMRPVINNLVGGVYAGPKDLLLALAPLLGIYLVGVAASYVQSATMARLAQKGTNRLRKDLFDRLQDLPVSYYDQHTHGELMSRFTNDADNVQMALEQSVVSLFSSALMFVGIVGMMIVVSPILFLITLVILGVTMLVFRSMGGKSRKYYREQQANLGRVNGNIQEMIEGLKVVKAFTHEEQAKEAFSRLNDDYRWAAAKANFYSTAIMPVAMNLNNVGYALTAAVGGLLAIFGGFDLGGFTVYLQYSRQVSQPLNQISQQLTTILSALAGAERIFEVMDTQPETDEGKVTLEAVNKAPDGTLSPAAAGRGTGHWAWRVPNRGRMTLVPCVKDGEGNLVRCPENTPDHLWAWSYPEGDPAQGLHRIRGAVTREKDCVLAELTGAVRFRDVDFSYVPGKQILHNVSVYANPGQKIAFVGSTGAGKTTITNLINRFYEIQDGVITYDGIDVKEIRKDDLRRSLGAVLQDTHLFTGTVMENIRYGRLDATDDECIAAARTAGAHSFIRRLPDGYRTMVTGDGSNLSQGQRQLLAIARAAVADPPVMILDEATSSIDTRTEAQIQKGMDALMEGRTVFVIAHRLSTVRNADCIVVIEGGRIQEKGSHAELLEQQGRYYQLYTGQFQLD
ncbi:ABC transporter ATP-binding protein [Candidatus Pseudoscillospira sp. SGI.172]|uniref:ABC transporter ATP-binding protein n=1 Tax=Candidatus Pseudoscillospira sp. SGI.172 TaxID=3420582 RepID=UPI003D05D483